MKDYISASPRATPESPLEQNRRLRLCAAAACSDLAVTVFALLETRAVLAQTLSESQSLRSLALVRGDALRAIVVASPSPPGKAEVSLGEVFARQPNWPLVPLRRSSAVCASAA
jgi:hypothetical protein